MGSLVKLPGNVMMNTDRCLELLSNYLGDCFECCKQDAFMQDSVLCRAAEVINEWFDFVQVDYIKDWEGNLPDLNPVENL